ncbi:MAG: toxic anion resistance protein [Methyloprofundus sp.]|nr:toxic anion resistance protein [Methyloprofundus sp.]
MSEEKTTEDITIPGSEVFHAASPSINIDILEPNQSSDKTALIASKLAEIDMSDSHSILFFGTKAQKELTAISDKMLEGVQNKDLGSAGIDLNTMVSAIRGFDIEAIDPNKKTGFFEKLLGKSSSISQFLQESDDVRKQIDHVTNKLDTHSTSLLEDITKLDRLYTANLAYFHELEIYIAAGEEKLKQLDTQDIPAKAQSAEHSKELIAAQELRDLRAARDDLERKVHDLRLTHQVTMQSLPSIRLVQENDKRLVNKINSTIVNTIPLWRQQLATAVAIYRSSEAAETLQSVTDLTNDLLEKNAANLKHANSATRKELERGVFDLKSVKQANITLIETINESLEIADAGKKMRADAVNELKKCENNLRESLAAAASKAAEIDLN